MPHQCAHWLAMTCRRQKGVCVCKDVARNAMQKEGRVRGCKDVARKVRGNMPGVSGGKALARNDMQKTVMCLRLQGRGCNGWLKFAGCLHGTGVLPELCRRTADVPVLPGARPAAPLLSAFYRSVGRTKNYKLFLMSTGLSFFRHILCVFCKSPPDI